MNRPIAVGLSVLAGAALLEAALIPGIVIGGGVLLVPRYLPGLRRRTQAALGSLVRRRTEPPAPLPNRPNAGLSVSLPGGLAIKQALAKTITFRVIVTSLDFTTNYLVIGDFAVAAGLSTFALVAGPLFYFTHETAWNYYLGPSRTSVDLPAILPHRPDAEADQEGITISRALAKTITFRTIATVMDFTTTYLVLGDLATAAVLTSIGFVVGPFVYIGHEMVWDYYTRPGSARLSYAPNQPLIGDRSRQLQSASASPI